MGDLVDLLRQLTWPDFADGDLRIQVAFEAIEEIERLRAENEALRREERQRGLCVWKEDDSGEFWSTGCGGAWTIPDGTPTQNEMRWCPRCGARLEEAQG